MKPKIELGREYSTRGGGKAVVHFIDSNKLIGRIKNPDNTRWVAVEWEGDGNFFAEEESHLDLLFPRTIMVPVEVPEWAKCVSTRIDAAPYFSSRTPDPSRGWIPIEDWIASLEDKDE